MHTLCPCIKCVITKQLLLLPALWSDVNNDITSYNDKTDADQKLGTGGGAET